MADCPAIPPEKLTQHWSIFSAAQRQIPPTIPVEFSFSIPAHGKAAKGGTNSSGFCDPFNATNVYLVALDTNYSNQITVPTNASGAPATITKHVGVWSIPKVGSTDVLINSWD